MNSNLASSIEILAQAEGGGGSGTQTMVMLVLMFVMFYFILIRPQKKRQKELDAKIKSLKTGMKVVTIGGINGIVSNVKERTLVVKVADNVKIEFEKSAVATVVNKDDKKPADDVKSLEDKK